MKKHSSTFLLMFVVGISFSLQASDDRGYIDPGTLVVPEGNRPVLDAGYIDTSNQTNSTKNPEYLTVSSGKDGGYIDPAARNDGGYLTAEQASGSNLPSETLVNILKTRLRKEIISRDNKEIISRDNNDAIMTLAELEYLQTELKEMTGYDTEEGLDDLLEALNLQGNVNAEAFKTHVMTLFKQPGEFTEMVKEAKKVFESRGLSVDRAPNNDTYMNVKSASQIPADYLDVSGRKPQDVPGYDVSAAGKGAGDGGYVYSDNLQRTTGPVYSEFPQNEDMYMTVDTEQKRDIQNTAESVMLKLTSGQEDSVSNAINVVKAFAQRWQITTTEALELLKPELDNTEAIADNGELQNKLQEMRESISGEGMYSEISSLKTPVTDVPGYDVVPAGNRAPQVPSEAGKELLGLKKEAVQALEDYQSKLYGSREVVTINNYAQKAKISSYQAVVDLKNYIQNPGNKTIFGNRQMLVNRLTYLAKNNGKWVQEARIELGNLAKQANELGRGSETYKKNLEKALKLIQTISEATGIPKGAIFRHIARESGFLGAGRRLLRKVGILKNSFITDLEQEINVQIVNDLVPQDSLNSVDAQVTGAGKANAQTADQALTEQSGANQNSIRGRGVGQGLGLKPGTQKPSGTPSGDVVISGQGKSIIDGPGKAKAAAEAHEKEGGLDRPVDSGIEVGAEEGLAR